MQITPEAIFDRVVQEFYDYHEVKSAIINHSELDIVESGAEREDRLNKLARKFKLDSSDIEVAAKSFSYEWHDDYEGRLIAQTTIEQILGNVKQSVLSELEVLNQAIKDRIDLKLEKLNAEIETIKSNVVLEDRKRLVFLKEQSEIAKELGIELNDMNRSSSGTSEFAVSVFSSDVPFYLRGYKAIDKEIALIETRSIEDSLSQNDRYVSLQKQLNLLGGEIGAEQFKKETELVSVTDPANWIVYDVSIAEVSSTRRTSLMLMLSLMVGGFISLLVVLFMNALETEDNQKLSTY